MIKRAPSSFIFFLSWLACGAATAQSQLLASFGEWEVTRGANYSIAAATFNDAGGVLAFRCSPDDSDCSWWLGVKLICEDDARFPVLINSRSGSVTVSATCMGRMGGAPDSLYGLKLTGVKQLVSATTAGEQVGFAVALSDGKFSVMRFSLDGSKKALQQIANLLRARRSEKRNGASTDQETL